MRINGFKDYKRYKKVVFSFFFIVSDNIYYIIELF